MKLGLSEIFDEWFDEHRRLALPNKWRGSSNNRLCTGYSHRPEEKYSEFSNEPLKYSIVKAELDKGHEKYNRLDFNAVSNTRQSTFPNGETVSKAS